LLVKKLVKKVKRPFVDSVGSFKGSDSVAARAGETTSEGTGMSYYTATISAVEPICFGAFDSFATEMLSLGFATGGIPRLA
jgi:hypothetical protein